MREVFRGVPSGTQAGEEMYRLVRDLYPICRSITGNGVRETLRRIGKIIPLGVHEIPTGTKVFDWTVPREWNIRDASIRNAAGEKVIDFRSSNLHVLNYSQPVSRRMPLSELKDHLFTLPEHPDWIPYRTSYYAENWGFCLSHNQMLSLEEGDYDVVIDASLENGSLTYGEYHLQGETADEILLSCHVCHPSLCNDNLSGIAVVTFLAKELRQYALRYSYRFLFIPGTIGSIAWLSRNEPRISAIRHGLVAACLGDQGPFTYKKSRGGAAEIDAAVIHVLEHSGAGHEVLDFSPFGYDERQYCSPGIDLPVGCLMRTPHGRYPEYHTSADDLDFISAGSLHESFAAFLSVFDVLEHNARYLNRFPKGEPQLGRRGLYRAIGGKHDGRSRELAMLWVLNQSDGRTSLLDIARKSGLAFPVISEVARILEEYDLLQECRNA